MQILTNRAEKLFIRLITLIVRGYQYFISPWLPASCRFYPSCSQYTREALTHYGLFKGARLSLIRISRCHPFSQHSGFDPIEKHHPDHQVKDQ